MSSPLRSKSALDEIAIPGRYGRKDGEPGIAISERVGLGLATVAARKGQAEALKAAVRASTASNCLGARALSKERP